MDTKIVRSFLIKSMRVEDLVHYLSTINKRNSVNYCCICNRLWEDIATGYVWNLDVQLNKDSGGGFTMVGSVCDKCHDKC